MLRIKLNHVSKSGPRCLWSDALVFVYTQYKSVHYGNLYKVITKNEIIHVSKIMVEESFTKINFCEI